MSEKYYEDMLEEVAINKYLNMIANDYNGELAKIFEEKYINKDKEIERLHSIIKEVREEIIKDREKQYSNLEKKAFYYNKTNKLLEILDKINKGD